MGGVNILSQWLSRTLKVISDPSKGRTTAYISLGVKILVEGLHAGTRVFGLLTQGSDGGLRLKRIFLCGFEGDTVFWSPGLRNGMVNKPVEIEKQRTGPKVLESRYHMQDWGYGHWVLR